MGISYHPSIEIVLAVLLAIDYYLLCEVEMSTKPAW